MDTITLKLTPQAVQTLLQVLTNTPLPHNVSNPLLVAIHSQAQQQLDAEQQPQAATLEQAPPVNRAARRAVRKKA